MLTQPGFLSPVVHRLNTRLRLAYPKAGLYISGEKKPAFSGFSDQGDESRLLDLAFLVEDVLTHDRVELLDFHLAGHVALVLGGRVKMTGTGAGNQADLISCCLSHGCLPRSDLITATAHLGDHCINTFLVDQAHGIGGQTQAHPAILALDPITMVVQVRQESTLGLIVGVGDVATRKRALTGYLADFGHDASLRGWPGVWPC